MSLDRIPGDANIYIGGLFSLRRKEALTKANITHVLSALRLPLDEKLFLNFKHHVVELDDVEDENIIEHFPASNAFIQQGLDGGTGVLVHWSTAVLRSKETFLISRFTEARVEDLWVGRKLLGIGDEDGHLGGAMGKSRSTTLVVAYLLSQNPSFDPQSALDLIRQSRPFAEPNSGFMEQLSLYHNMNCPSTQEALDNHPLYQRWLYRRTVEASVAAGVAPEVSELRFGDEGNATPINLAAEEGPTDLSASEKPLEPTISYRCRRCRTPLATSAYLVPHSPKRPATSQPCAHIHLTPLSWMRPELEQGKLEGRLECPNQNCGQSVGRYAWQGMKCSCGEWVVPGMTLGRGRIDEMKRPRAGVGGDKI